MPKMRGQMSLEMIIGLVILLVVAGVVISMLLHFLSPESMPNIDDELNERGFITECDKLCDSGDMVEYCSYYYGKGETGMIDLNKDNQENSRVLVGAQDWPACESRVYCFLYAPCRRMGSTSTNVMKECSEILCNNYLNKYDNNAEHANKAVLDKIRVSTEETNVPYCNFLDVPEEENWHKLYFPEDVCGEEEVVIPLSFGPCILDNTTWSITCDTNCQYVAGKLTVIGVVDKDGNVTQAMKNGVTSGTIDFLTGKIKFTTVRSLEFLDNDTSQWGVSLVCSNPKDSKSVVGVS